MAYRFEFRRDTAEAWTLKNPVLLPGEPGLEWNTRRVKYGDGATPWNDLEYSGTAGSGVDFDTFQAHIDNPNPHPTYDDGSSFVLLYENAKV